MLTETARIKQNRAENAKPSQFSRVFSEVSGGLRRDKGILQALIGEECSDTETLLEYLSEIPCMELTKQYRLDWDKLDDNRFVQFYGNTSEGKTILCVGQNYMKLSVYQPYREKCYILEKPLDMDYVLSLF